MSSRANNDTAPRQELLLRLGDSCLVLGQRLSEWCGHAPALELDLAASNMALDLIGQANEWLGYAGELEPDGRSADQLAFLRDTPEFRNFLLVEQPNGDWGQTMVRLYLFSVWHVEILGELAESTDERIAAIAAKSLSEARYHMRFAEDWMLRLGDGTEESHARVAEALDRLWRFTGEMFLDSLVDEKLAAAGVSVLPSSIKDKWTEGLEPVFGAAGLSPPDTPTMISGAMKGHHSEHLGHILSELQFLQRAYPGLEW